MPIIPWATRVVLKEDKRGLLCQASSYSIMILMFMNCYQR